MRRKFEHSMSLIFFSSIRKKEKISQKLVVFNFLIEYNRSSAAIDATGCKKHNKVMTLVAMQFH